MYKKRRKEQQQVEMKEAAELMLLKTLSLCI